MSANFRHATLLMRLQKLGCDPLLISLCIICPFLIVVFWFFLFQEEEENKTRNLSAALLTKLTNLQSVAGTTWATRRRTQT